MEIDTEEYLEEVTDNIRKTGFASSRDKDRIALSLGATAEDIRTHGASYCIDVCIEDVPEHLEEEYRRSKALAPQLQDLATAILEMRIDVIRLISTGIDKYGILDELATSLRTAWQHLSSNLLYIDIDRLDRLLGAWQANANTFSGLPEKYIKEIRGKVK